MGEPVSDHPLPHGGHEKPLQDATDLNVGHGAYIAEPDGQDAAWADAVTPDGEPHPDAGEVGT